MPLAMPKPLTRLIGREAELAAVRDELHADNCRLLTLTGSGGVGKTRLALAVAASMEDAFPDGSYFVDLAPLTNPDLVLPAIAGVLGVRAIAGQQLSETLAAFLAPKRLLFLLDNCERVIAAASHITMLLAACPRVTVLATSREPFHIRGEHEFPVVPLPVPTAVDSQAVQTIEAMPAVVLFVERATGVKPEFILGTDNAAAVAEICRHWTGCRWPSSSPPRGSKCSRRRRC